MHARHVATIALCLPAFVAAGLLTAGVAVAGPGFPTDGLLVHHEHGSIELHVPWDYPTIQAAIDASRPGDVIFVGAGLYEESLTIRHRDGLTLRAAGANHTVVRSPGTILLIESTPSVHIEGFRFESPAEIVIEARGSGVAFWRNVVVADAPSGDARIDLYCSHRSEFVRNTFVRPDAGNGAFLRLNPDQCAAAAPVSVRRNLFWTWGKPVADYAERATITENNLGITSPDDFPEDNLFSFPLFCDPAQGFYTLSPGSPCLPDNNPWGRTIGALSQGCGPVGVEPSSWGRIKGGYR